MGSKESAIENLKKARKVKKEMEKALGHGLRKGTKNRFTGDIVKYFTDVVKVLDDNGMGLMMTALANPEEFNFKVLPKLLPKEIRIDGSLTIAGIEGKLQEALAKADAERKKRGKAAKKEVTRKKPATRKKPTGKAATRRTTTK